MLRIIRMLTEEKKTDGVSGNDERAFDGSLSYICTCGNKARHTILLLFVFGVYS